MAPVFLVHGLLRFLLWSPFRLPVLAEPQVSGETFEFACHFSRCELRIFVLPEGPLKNDGHAHVSACDLVCHVVGGEAASRR